MLFPIDWAEPFGLVMIEAMACGTPVIAYGSGSVPEIIIDGVNGFIVDSIDSAVEAVAKLDSISREECRAAFEDRFTVDRMARDYLEVYARVIARSSEDSASFQAAPARRRGTLTSSRRARACQRPLTSAENRDMMMSRSLYTMTRSIDTWPHTLPTRAPGRRGRSARPGAWPPGRGLGSRALPSQPTGQSFSGIDEVAPSLVAIAANVLIGIGMLFANKRFLQSLDELQRTIQLQAMAWSLGAGLVGSLAWTLFARLDLVAFEAGLAHLIAFMALVYLAGCVAGLLRYR